MLKEEIKQEIKKIAGDIPENVKFNEKTYSKNTVGYYLDEETGQWVVYKNAKSEGHTTQRSQQSEEDALKMVCALLKLDLDVKRKVVLAGFNVSA